MTLAPTRDTATTWVPVCTLADLEIERGRAALIEDTQVAPGTDATRVMRRPAPSGTRPQPATRLG